MKKVTDYIYSFFGIIFFLSFFLTILSGIFFTRLNIGDHSFNVPVFFISLFFIGMFVIFTFNPSWGGAPRTVGGWKKHLVSLLMLLFAIATSYFGIYLPLHSKFLAEIPSQFLNQPEPFIISAQANKKYYIEVDSTFTKKGTDIKFTASNDNWSEDFSFNIGKKSADQRNKAVSGTDIVDLPFNFPTNGTYKLYIKFENGSDYIYRIRLFEKN